MTITQLHGLIQYADLIGAVGLRDQLTNILLELTKNERH